MHHFVVYTDANITRKPVNHWRRGARAACFASTREPISQSSAVVIAGRTAAAIARSALPTIIPHARSFSNCSGLLMDIELPSPFYFDLAPENADANPSAIRPPPETLRWMR